MTKYTNYFPLLTILLFSSLIAWGKEKINNGSIPETEYSISPGTYKTRVSDLILGINLSYPHEKDAIWQDGKIVDYLKEINVSLLRYPGGTECSYYHWNSLTGEGWKDSWDINNPVISKPPSEFMGPTKKGNFTPSRSAMAQVEMMMQFISAGLDYAVFWPLHWPDESINVRSFINTSTNTANPNYHLFKFLGKMQGGDFIESNIIKAGRDMLSLTVQNHDMLRVCLMNKAPVDQVTEILLDKYPGFRFKEGKAYVVNSDGSDYALFDLELIQTDNPAETKFLSKTISITMLTFERK